MKNDIYDLLNDIDNQIDTFENIDITSNDLKNWKQSFTSKKKASVKKHTWKKYVASAAAFVLILGGSSAPIRQNVYAQSQQIMESLSTLLGVQEDLSPYSTMVGKSVSKNGITVTLNEVILDGHSLIISYKTKVKDNATLKNLNIKHITELPIDIDVTIGGHNIVDSLGSSSTPIDKLTSISESEIQLDDSSVLSEKSNFTINFYTLDKSNTHIGKLKFAASGKELNAKTKNIALNQSFTLPDKTKITLNNYRSNIVDQKITFTISQNNVGLPGDILLKGKDNLGNPVEFFLGDSDGTSGTFRVDKSVGSISPKATSLTLTPYCADCSNLSSDSDSNEANANEESGSVKVIGSGNTQTFAVSKSDSTEKTTEDTDSNKVESTEIKVDSERTDSAQEITISDYKRIGTSFTIPIR